MLKCRGKIASVMGREGEGRKRLVVEGVVWGWGGVAGGGNGESEEWVVGWSGGGGTVRIVLAWAGLIVLNY